MKPTVYMLSFKEMLTGGPTGFLTSVHVLQLESSLNFFWLENCLPVESPASLKYGRYVGIYKNGISHCIFEASYNLILDTEGKIFLFVYLDMLF